MNRLLKPGPGLVVLAICLGVAGLSWVGLTRAREACRARRTRPVIETLVPAPEPATIARQRVLAKTQVVDQLLARKLTLLEAAAWFLYINDHPAESPDNFRKFIPGRSDGEKACRQVIRWVSMRFNRTSPNNPDRAIVQQLEEELDALLTESGDVELPW
jgi:hypothetical protein